MSNKIKKGTEVKWSSSGRGSKAVKRGEVLRFLDRGANVRDFIPKKILVSQIMTRNYESSHQRYLVVVSKGDEVLYFTPRAATINEQNGFGPEKKSKSSKKAPSKKASTKSKPAKKSKAKAKVTKVKAAVTEVPAEAAKAA